MKPIFVPYGEHGWIFWCPGCDEPHAINDTWHLTDIQGETPTVEPSILVSDGDGPKCHSFVRHGQILFLDDCKHAQAGKTIPLTPWADNAPWAKDT